MDKRIDYRFRALVKVGSLDESLVRYLRTKDAEISEREKLLLPASAYWLPWALEAQGNQSAQRIKQSVRTSIYRLRQHINHMAQTFGLEDEIETLPSTRSNQSEVVSKHVDELAFYEPLAQMPASTESESQSTVEPQLSDLLQHQDDETFHEMFVN